MNLPSGSIRTATTENKWRGRFAPSPTGPLHFGSLVAATASYLQARVRRGEWLLRIEDLDPPREAPGAAERIISTLQVHGFHWDGPADRQSSHLSEYHAIAGRLLADDFAYRCTCSREEVRQASTKTGPAGVVYPGTCRHLGRRAVAGTPDALRLRTGDSIVTFKDTVQGTIHCNVAASIGDFVIRRKDGLIAYNLATVIDDARQGITEIVRGCDLLDVTPAQIVLQRILKFATPTYMHVPLVINERGQKLSKQTGAQPIDGQKPDKNLIAALEFLRQDPPAELAGTSVEAIWAWATANWHPEKLAARRQSGQKINNKSL